MTDVFDLVKQDLDSRNQLGTETYGGPMHVNDRRDWLLAAYEEALDLAVYLRAEIEKRRTCTTATK